MVPFRGALWFLGWPARAVLLVLIGAYRLTIGQVVGGNCRFYPSCSEYAQEAIASAGAVRGLGLSVWRVLRCSPLSPGGIDYPPGSAETSSTEYDAVIRLATRIGKTEEVAG
jgi:putative membrane protein insertion efficiency factor